MWGNLPGPFCRFQSFYVRKLCLLCNAWGFQFPLVRESGCPNVPGNPFSDSGPSLPQLINSLPTGFPCETLTASESRRFISAGKVRQFLAKQASAYEKGAATRPAGDQLVQEAKERKALNPSAPSPESWELIPKGLPQNRWHITHPFCGK